MDAADADRDGLSVGDLKRALLVLCTSDLEIRIAIAVGVSQRQGFRAAFEPNPHALERAGEQNLIHRAAREVTGCQGFPCWGNLDFLRSYDSDDLVLTSPVYRGRGARAHGTLAKADPFFGLSRENQVRCAKERGHEARRRTRVELIRPTDLEQAAVIHDTDAVGQREGLLLVVGDEHCRNAQLALHLADGPAQLLADFRVQRAERLVQQENLGFMGERARYRDPLLLAAGKLRGQALIHALEGDEAKQLLPPLATLAGFHAPDSQREFDIFGDRHVTEERVVLEYQPHAAAAGSDVGDVTTVKGDPAVVDSGQTGDGAQQGALATAARSEEYEEFTVTDVQRHIVDDRDPLVALRHLI